MRYALLLLLAACETAPTFGEYAAVTPEHRRVWARQYTWDDTCSAAHMEGAKDLVRAGFELWEEMGARITEGESRITVCLREGYFWGTRLGMTTWDGSAVRIDLVMANLDWATGVAAHEMGHVLLTNNHHLPGGSLGIMAADTLNGGFFTDADIDFLWDEGFFRE